MLNNRTSAEEGGVKVWEPTSAETSLVLRPILARGAQGLTHWGLTLNTLLAFCPPPRLGDSPLEFEGEQQDSSGASQWLTVSSKMLQKAVVSGHNRALVVCA